MTENIKNQQNDVDSINNISDTIQTEFEDNFDFKEYFLNFGSDDSEYDDCNNNYDEDTTNNTNNTNIKKTHIQSKTIYENKELYSKNGELIGFIPEKRFNWYLKKGLCDLINENSIMLNFEPNYRNQKVVIDREKQVPKKNMCVICGSEKNLKRFRVIPYEIKKYFPDYYKAHISSDVVVICENNASDGDFFNKELKLKLFKQYDVDTDKFKIESKKKNMYITIKKISKQNFKCNNVYTEKTIKKFFGTYPTEDEMNKFIEEIDNFSYMGFKTPEELLVANVIKKNEMEIFIKSWKQNFVDIMDPKFLQWDYWN